MLAECSNPHGALTTDQLSIVINKALSHFSNLKRVLLIHPDYSRHDFTDTLVPMIHDHLAAQGLERLDTLNAPGTHRPMEVAEITKKLGLTSRPSPKIGKHLNHHFDDPQSLISAGIIKEEFVHEKTQGYVNKALEMHANKHLFDPEYDAVIAINGIVPHEGTGYSGGTKIFFPGLAAPDAIGLFHWAAVLMGVPEIIGRINNPAREIVNEGARLIFEKIGSKPIISLSMVYTEDESHRVVPRGLFADEGTEGFKECLHAAATLSSQLHLVYVDQPLDVVVQQIPAMYDEVWTAGKGSYKLQKPGVLAPGAEIILYAPHIHCFHSNPVMDKLIRQIGYHGRDFVIEYLKKNPTFDRNVAAHVINVRGIGSLDNDKESFPFKVTLATQISESECHAVHLGYRDPKTIHPADFKATNKLWIEQGGQWLYAPHSN